MPQISQENKPYQIFLISRFIDIFRSLFNKLKLTLMSNALVLTKSALEAPKSTAEMFELEAFKMNAIANYEKTTGQKNGALVYERERILFMKLLSDPKAGKKLQACTRFSIYSAFIELFVSALTLNDGLAYIIPYGDVAQFQVGWKGRLEQMSRMPQIREVYAPEVVMTNELDDFEYTLGENPRIIQHKPAKNRDLTPENRIEWAYVVLDKGHRKKCVLMGRQQILSIRDRYSKPYINYIKNGGKWPDGGLMDPPFWITDEIQAFKKTVVKRAYDSEPKTPRQRLLDEKIKTYIDFEDGTQESEGINYGIADDQSGATGNLLQAHQGVTDQQKGSGSPGGNAGPSQGGGEPVKEKRSHKKKEPSETKAAESETKTAVTESGTKYDTETAEEIADGPGDDNPAADLPDLGGLKNF
jgi:recombinational DNA repair protein RecT